MAGKLTIEVDSSQENSSLGSVGQIGDSSENLSNAPSPSETIVPTRSPDEEETKETEWTNEGNVQEKAKVVARFTRTSKDSGQRTTTSKKEKTFSICIGRCKGKEESCEIVFVCIGSPARE